MLKIPYGATVSYGDIAKALERKHGGRVSAQAVGGAVGWNPKTGRTQRKTAMKKLMVATVCAAMVALEVEDTESHAFLREGVDLS